MICRGHFVYVPSQWEMTLQCNVVSHWLGAYTKCSLGLWALTYSVKSCTAGNGVLTCRPCGWKCISCSAHWWRRLGRSSIVAASINRATRMPAFWEWWTEGGSENIVDWNMCCNTTVPTADSREIFNYFDHNCFLFGSLCAEVIKDNHKITFYTYTG